MLVLEYKLVYNFDWRDMIPRCIQSYISVSSLSFGFPQLPSNIGSGDLVPISQLIANHSLWCWLIDRHWIILSFKAFTGKNKYNASTGPGQWMMWHMTSTVINIKLRQHHTLCHHQIEVKMANIWRYHFKINFCERARLYFDSQSPAFSKNYFR